ncbi:uncharacterized protein tmem70 isoform X2 [Chiloscyllium plagiosum]|uniref:uncharacterized protein tmem70 isoform X2 n=1 Tax=Chiloscyllium plagiosum TaxID=36176 RepID=UPI001CB7BFD8|nr:uncharacterized protein tmem70 isoform X2 [Chiloscyllium plagiosum]
MAAAALVMLGSRSRSGSLRRLTVRGLWAAARPLSALSVHANRPTSQAPDGPRGPRFVGSCGRPQIYLALGQPIRHLCSDGSNLEGRLIYSGNLARVVLDKF